MEEINNMTYKKSNDIGVELDKQLFRQVKDINSEVNHKHLTNGVIMTEMLSMFDFVTVEDSASELEEYVDAELVENNLDPAVVEDISVDGLSESEESEKVWLYMPQAVIDQLDYFKSDQLETVLQKYSTSPFNSRKDRIDFKRKVLEIKSSDDTYKTAELPNRYVRAFEQSEELREFVNTTKWYDTFDSGTLRERASEICSTKSEKIEAVEVAIEKEREEFISMLESDLNNSYALFDMLLEEQLSFETVRDVVDNMFDVSGPTSRDYTNKVDVEIENLEIWLLNKVEKDKLLSDFVRAEAEDGERVYTINKSDPIDITLYAVLENNEGVYYTEVDGVEYKFTLEGTTMKVKEV